ncbi:TetR family transcriptional regulator C-terminal domain-containing protein [Nocardiopsis sp. CNR-923]|uniref:TetR family transcriptional regulator C-terminal domain-containing protein n=1 Tax=Nocardiopsis sp. CNR-923 TaxID=1904965 RepID=UPI00117C8EF1|nr:TetR family transcriptional regulator C-terminal domain-containing protein [Nocardiopsis sp. CNR-923]
MPLLRQVRADRAEVARLAARFLLVSATRDRKRSLARYELASEAGRNPELRETYDRLGERFRTMLDELFSALGSPTPRRHTRAFLAWVDGMLFDSLAGVGARAPPGRGGADGDGVDPDQRALGRRPGARGVGRWDWRYRPAAPRGWGRGGRAREWEPDSVLAPPMTAPYSD